NEIKSFSPLFNRAVIFETNEYSWHGFPKINLPADKQHLSRKSISIYLYTRTRPAGEAVPEHGTFYVQRPLPAHLRPGHMLTQMDIDDINDLLKRRDDWLAHYHKVEIAVSGQSGELRHRLIAGAFSFRCEIYSMVFDRVVQRDFRITRQRR